MADQTLPNTHDHAGVRVPPPLIYGVMFGLGLALNLIIPFGFVPAMLVRAAALIFLGAGVWLTGWSNLLFRRAHTSLVPVKPTTALVLAGPYRITRNPMYLGLLCVYVAAALWFGVAWALVLVPLVILAVQRMVIAREERYLERKFGDQYRQYRARVRRWI